MKKLFVKFIIFFLILLAADKSYGLLADYIYNKSLDYPMGFFNGYGKIAYKIDEDIVIIGDSKATHDIIPTMISDSIGMSCVNASKDGAGFLVQNYLVNKMLDRYSPKVIIWEWDAIGLSNYMFETEMDRITDLVPFYGNDSQARDLVNRRSTFERIKMFSSIYRWNGKISAFVNILKNPNAEDVDKGYVAMKSNRNFVLTKRTIQFPDDLDTARVNAFQKTINRIKSNNIKLIIVSSPQYEQTNLEQTIQGRKLSQIIKENNLIWFNHHFDDRFLNDEKLFFDNDHLDAKAAPDYTLILIGEIKPLLLN